MGLGVRGLGLRLRDWRVGGMRGMRVSGLGCRGAGLEFRVEGGGWRVEGGGFIGDAQDESVVFSLIYI